MNKIKNILKSLHLLHHVAILQALLGFIKLNKNPQLDNLKMVIARKCMQLLINTINIGLLSQKHDFWHRLTMKHTIQIYVSWEVISLFSKIYCTFFVHSQQHRDMDDINPNHHAIFVKVLLNTMGNELSLLQRWLLPFCSHGTKAFRCIVFQGSQGASLKSWELSMDHMKIVSSSFSSSQHIWTCLTYSTGHWV